MNEKDKLSIIPFTFFFFLGLYVVIKFFLVVFWTLNFNPRFIMELTPFFLLKMNPVQLFILSAIVAGSDAYFHFQDYGRNMVYSFIPSFIMIIGIGTSIYLYEWESPFYYMLFAVMLAAMLMDYRYILSVKNRYFDEDEEENSAEEPDETADKKRNLEEDVKNLKKDLERVKTVLDIYTQEESEVMLEEEMLEDDIEDDLEIIPPDEEI